MTELEKALSGKSYDSRDQEIVSFQNAIKRQCRNLNQMDQDDPKRNKLIDKLVTGYNAYVFIEEGFSCVFGKNIHFEGMAVINYNCTFLDLNIITIGDRTVIGAGSVVTKDIPSDVIAFGNPCNVYKQIGKQVNV